VSDSSKRPPGRPRKYERDGEGAPFLGVRLDPELYNYIKTRSEGPRAYIERLVSDDKELCENRDGNAVGTLNLQYWRVYLKGAQEPLTTISDLGGSNGEIDRLEDVAYGYYIGSEQLQSAEAVVNWMCQIEEKSWMTANSLREFFRILQAFGLVRRYGAPNPHCN